MSDENISDAVFQRIREVYSLPSDAAMARHLGIFPQDVPRMRKTGNLPYKQILNVCPAADWEYIFQGRRPPERSDGPISLPVMIQRVIDAGYRVERSDFGGISPET